MAHKLVVITRADSGKVLLQLYAHEIGSAGKTGSTAQEVRDTHSYHLMVDDLVIVFTCVQPLFSASDSV